MVLREAWATLPESSSHSLQATLAQSRNLAHASLETAVLQNFKTAKKKVWESTSLTAGGVGRPGQLPDLGVPQGPRHRSGLKSLPLPREILGVKGVKFSGNPQVHLSSRLSVFCISLSVVLSARATRLCGKFEF